jgi:hypothetical protein
VCSKGQGSLQQASKGNCQQATKSGGWQGASRGGGQNANSGHLAIALGGSRIGVSEQKEPKNQSMSQAILISSIQT